MATLGEDLEEIELKFNAASKHLPSILSNVPSQDLLYFYARYKQATVGPCNTEKPGFFDFKGKYHKKDTYIFLQVTFLKNGTRSLLKLTSENLKN